MTCAICHHGTLVDGVTTVTLERGGATVVFKEVPARLCDNCGEDYVDDVVTRQLLTRVDEAVAAGTEVDVRRWVAA